MKKLEVVVCSDVGDIACLLKICVVFANKSHVVGRLYGYQY